jgi:hypothetical protein
MPDFEVIMTKTTGRHEGKEISVTVQDVANRETAKVAGIGECLKSAEESDSETFKPALDYWMVARNTGYAPLYEVLTELETAWNLTFVIKDVLPAGLPPPAAAASRRVTPPRQNGAAAPIPKQFDLKQMLAEQLTSLQERQKELSAQRKLLDAEYQQNAESLADIRNFLLVSAVHRAPRRRKVEANADTQNA